MVAGIKYSTLKNIFWNFAEQFLSKGISIASNLILAWFLVPEDYALVAMLAVFIALSNVLVDAGFGQALIRKLEVSNLDLNTVFWTNIGLSVVIYGLVYVGAPWVAYFYNEERLEYMIQIVTLAIFFQSLIVVQKAVLSRELNFKLQVKVVLPAAFLSSIIAVWFAYMGFGVLALIYQILANSFLLFVFYWLLKLWRPSFEYSFNHLKELWKFSRFIVADSIISIPFKNMYLIMLPKFFALGPVGLYFFAEKIKEVVIGLIVNSVQTVTYPALTKLQEDNHRLKEGYRILVGVTTFLMFPSMLALAALAPLLFDLLLPEKWQGAWIYLQLMIFAFLMYPIHSLNLNILQVKGRPDLLLYIGIYKKIVVIGIFIYTVQFGIVEVIIGHIFASIFNYIPNAYYSSKLIDYSIREQMADFIPSLILSGLIAGLIYWLQLTLNWLPLVELVGLSIMASVLYLTGAYLLKLHAYQHAQELLFKRFKKKSVIL